MNAKTKLSIGFVSAFALVITGAIASALLGKPQISSAAAILGVTCIVMAAFGAIGSPDNSNPDIIPVDATLRYRLISESPSWFIRSFYVVAVDGRRYKVTEQTFKLYGSLPIQEKQF